ncbi:MAG: prenyltransferase/squalene oxidase repeat-containing protein [Acidobacteriota bacterium]
MSEATWWRHLRGDPSRFLLDDEEPGVVWRTQLELLARPGDSPAVQRAREQARRKGAATYILAQQHPMGYWGSPGAYGARWSGTAWQVIALAALGADPEDPRVDRAAATLLQLVQPTSGGFSPARGKIPASCFTAEVCAALARFGFAHHPRLREAMAWLAEREGGHGGWTCPELRHLIDGGCPVTAVAVLRLVAELGENERSRLRGLAERAASWLLDHGLFLSGGAPRGWLEFCHPELSRTDLLDALAAMARAGRPMAPPIAATLPLVIARQDDQACWRQHHRVPFGEPAGEPSRWLTLKALVALAAYGVAPLPAEAPV